MTKEDVLKLVNAGFTKEDIIKLAEPTPAPEEPKQGEPKTKPTKEETKTETAPEVKAPVKPTPEEVKQGEDFSEYVKEVVNDTFEPFKELYNNMAKLAGMPSMGNVKPLGADDVISNFLKDI